MLKSLRWYNGTTGNSPRPGLKPEYVYYVVEALFNSSTSFIAPVYVVFLIRSGLDYKGVAMVDGLYMISSALLDYPTGGLADRYGRGRVTAIGCALFGAGLLSYSLSRRLHEFLFSEFLAAIGMALYSGAFVAWLVDSLKEEKRSEDLSVVLGTSGTLTWLVGVIGAFVGGLLAEYSLRIPFVAGSLFCFTSAFIALYLTRGRGESPAIESRKPYLSLLKDGIIVLFRNKPLLWLTVGAFFVSAGLPSFTLTWAPYMEMLGAEKWLLGLASSAFMATVGLANYVGGRIARGIGYGKTILTSLALIAATFSLLQLVGDPYLFILASLPFEAGFGLMTPAIRAWINTYIPSEERATVISLRRTLVLPFSAAGMAAMGVLSDLGSPRLAFLFGLSMVLAAVPVYVKVLRKSN
ncbi:MAG: hypothetical protein DRJ41_01595 [Thermoprotei archaeon]|nr:MAG: hypothetical protein DRJ41_01595 [Thermoprotei archaeon]